MKTGFHPRKGSFEQIAAQIINLASYSIAEARNAYSGLLLIPGFDQLKFCTLLIPQKKQWSKSRPKYASFWNATECIGKLANQKLDRGNVRQVRDRLLIAWRFFHLARSIDLARLYRTVASVDGRHFVLMQRTGWRSPGWHEVMVLDNADLSPCDLLLLYVPLTARQANPGYPVFLALHAPIPPSAVTELAV